VLAWLIVESWGGVCTTCYGCARVPSEGGWGFAGQVDWDQLLEEICRDGGGYMLDGGCGGSKGANVFDEGGRTGGGGGIQRACFVVVKASYQRHLITYIGLAFLHILACSSDVATGIEDWDTHTLLNPLPTISAQVRANARVNMRCPHNHPNSARTSVFPGRKNNVFLLF
jgi:hypothetical protein